MYTTLLFDLDDTLWDFRANARVALEQMFHQLKLENYFESYQQFYQLYVDKNHELWAAYSKGEIDKEYLSLERFLYPLRCVGYADNALAREMGERFLRISAQQTLLVNGAIDVLDYLKPKYNMALISNGFTEVQYTKINNSGLKPYFDKIFLSEELGYQKPDVRFFEAAKDIMKFNSETTLVIGDNFDTDIVGANNAKIDSLFFQRDTIVDRDMSIPKIVITDLNELVEIL